MEDLEVIDLMKFDEDEIADSWNGVKVDVFRFFETENDSYFIFI